MLVTSLIDLRQSLKAWRLWSLLGWIEIRQRYARSTVGPFWLTISMAVIICSIGAVYGTLFGMILKDYLPYLSVGLVGWGLFSQIVNEGSTAYINSANYIKQAATPKLIFVFQVVWRNLIILAHNVVIIIILLAIFGIKDWSVIPMIIPGLVVFILNTTWMAMIGGMLSSRFRDLPQIITSIIQVAFYITPIVFKADSLKRFGWIVTYNPLAYMMDLIRMPLLGQMPPLVVWEVTLPMMIIGWIVALLVTGRFLKRLPYWV